MGSKFSYGTKQGSPKLLCPRATQAITEHIEGRTSYVMWLFLDMLHSNESTKFW